MDAQTKAQRASDRKRGSAKSIRLTPDEWEAVDLLKRPDESMQDLLRRLLRQSARRVGLTVPPPPPPGRKPG